MKRKVTKIQDLLKLLDEHGFVVEEPNGSTHAKVRYRGKQVCIISIKAFQSARALLNYVRTIKKYSGVDIRGGHLGRGAHSGKIQRHGNRAGEKGSVEAGDGNDGAHSGGERLGGGGESGSVRGPAHGGGRVPGVSDGREQPGTNGANGDGVPCLVPRLGVWTRSQRKHFAQNVAYHRKRVEPKASMPLDEADRCLETQAASEEAIRALLDQPDRKWGDVEMAAYELLTELRVPK